MALLLSHASHIEAPAPGPQTRRWQISQTCPLGRHPRRRSFVTSFTCIKRSLSSIPFARASSDSSYVYAEKIDASTERNSDRDGDELAARVRKARRMRRKEVCVRSEDDGL